MPLIGRRGRRLGGITRGSVEKLEDNFEVPSCSGAQRILSVTKRVRMGNTQSICVMIVALRPKLTPDLIFFECCDIPEQVDVHLSD